MLSDCKRSGWLKVFFGFPITLIGMVCACYMPLIFREHAWGWISSISGRSLRRAEPKWTLLYLHYDVCYSLSCVISDFRRGLNEIFALLGYYRCRLIVIYRRFGTAYRFRLQRAAGPIGWLETSENNYQSTPWRTKMSSLLSYSKYLFNVGVWICALKIPTILTSHH